MLLGASGHGKLQQADTPEVPEVRLLWTCRCAWQDNPSTKLFPGQQCFSLQLAWPSQEQQICFGRDWHKCHVWFWRFWVWRTITLANKIQWSVAITFAAIVGHTSRNIDLWLPWEDCCNAYTIWNSGICTISCNNVHTFPSTAFVGLPRYTSLWNCTTVVAFPIEMFKLINLGGDGRFPSQLLERGDRRIKKAMRPGF